MIILCSGYIVFVQKSFKVSRRDPLFYKAFYDVDRKLSSLLCVFYMCSLDEYAQCTIN